MFKCLFGHDWRIVKMALQQHEMKTNIYERCYRCGHIKCGWVVGNWIDVLNLGETI